MIYVDREGAGLGLELQARRAYGKPCFKTWFALKCSGTRSKGHLNTLREEMSDHPSSR